MQCVATTKMDWTEEEQVPLHCYDMYKSQLFGLAHSDMQLREKFADRILCGNSNAWLQPAEHDEMCVVDTLAILLSSHWTTKFTEQLKRCTT